MKTKAALIKLNFPFGLYFQQLFCPDIYVKFVNPFSFWRKYRIAHLETCWELNVARYLEGCYQLEWQPDIPQLLLTDTYQNTILISQPCLELKYRGVTYSISGISAIKISQTKTHPSQIILEQLAILPSCNL
jgi:hypothetical protein